MALSTSPTSLMGVLHFQVSDVLGPSSGRPTAFAEAPEAAEQGCFLKDTIGGT